MNGYDVVTTEDKKIGTVVDEHGEYLVVEMGALFKSLHGLPKAFAHALDQDRIVRVTVSKSLVAESPKVDGGWDEQAVARHYGLASGYEQPETAGDGELLPDDPAESAAVEGRRHGVKPADQERAEIREGRHDESKPAVHDRSATAFDPFGQTANRH
jgi:hypothetical protein